MHFSSTIIRTAINSHFFVFYYSIDFLTRKHNQKKSQKKSQKNRSDFVCISQWFLVGCVGVAFLLLALPLVVCKYRPVFLGVCAVWRGQQQTSI